MATILGDLWDRAQNESNGIKTMCHNYLVQQRECFDKKLLEVPWIQRNPYIHGVELYVSKSAADSKTCMRNSQPQPIAVHHEIPG
jgi:hypothetical protein